MHRLGKEKAYKAIPAPPVHPIENEDISNMFDNCMNQLEKFPQKLVVCKNLTDAICIRMGFGSIIRMNGTFLEEKNFTFKIYTWFCFVEDS